MKKLTRILALLLALVLVFALLGGCGGKKEGTAKEPAPPSEEPTQAPEETPDEEPDEGVSGLPLVDELTELTLWATINPNALRVIDSYSENSAIKAAVELTNVYLKCTSVAGNLAMEQYPIMISTGDYTDMMNSTSQLYPGGCDAAVDDGVMIDLSPYLEEYAPDYWNLVKDKEEYVKTFTTDKGRIVEFVPVVMNGYVDAGYILRKDWLDAVGMEVPTTYDELYEVLTAWKNELGKPNALYINNLGVGNQNSLTDGFGLATVYDPMQNFYPYYVVDGQVKYAYEQDEFKDYLKMMNKWYKEDLVWKDFPTQPTVMSFAQSDAALSDFLNGKLGAVFGEMGDIKAKPKASNDPDMVLVGMPNPVMKKGEKTKITTNEPGVQGTWGVTTSCEKVELAVRYINFWYTDVGAELANWGIEGEAFEWVNGERVWTELMTNNPDGLDIKALSTIYIIDDGPFLNYADKFLTMYSDEERAASETWMSVRTGEWTYPGGAQLNLEESELFATKFNDMYTYVAETVPRFITGELDIDAKWEEFISMMNQMGAQECLQAKQAAYDRYQAR